MKKIFLLFAAAVAVLSSCVKENGLEPQVNTDGKVTINAVAVDSKTVLDGLNVVWENEDALSVVLAGDVTSVAEFSAESVDGAEAKFVYAGTEALALEDATSAYAVYPASAVSQEGGVVKISHSLPEVQTGVVESGMNLSSAALSVEELVAGQATAQFKNALALLQVVVPAGVKEVSLRTATGAALVGDMTFNVVDGVLSVASNGTKRTVTLSTGSELAEGTHNLLVYPGYAPTLTLTMTATDDAVYTSEVSAIRFTASESRKINLTQIFKMGTEETMYASPAGGEVVVPVVTVADYTYEVAIDGNPEWLTCSLPTKAFHGENIVFTAAQNDTGVERSANVTISWGEDQTRTFTIAQKAIYMDFVNDSDGNPIKWEETFGLYSSESSANNGTNAVVNYKNVFTIELSDDFNKGTYKLVGAFIENDAFVGKAGATYYANYENNVLSVIKSDAGYAFEAKAVSLTYDEVNKEFSAAPIKFGYKFSNADLKNGGFIGGYKAVVKVEEPAGPSGPSVELGDAVKVLGNTYVESYSLSGAYGNTPGNLVFEESDDLSKGNVIITRIFGCAATGMYATVSGNTITTIESASIEYLQGDAPIGQLTLTIGSDGNITMEDQPLYSEYYLEGYVATKQGGAAEPEVPADPIAGTWDVTCNFLKDSYSGSCTEQTGTMHISKSGEVYTIDQFMGMNVTWTLSQSDNTFTYTHDYGLKLTLVYDAAAGTLKSDATDFGDYQTFKVNSINATKKGGAAEEPTEPEQPGVTVDNIVGDTWAQDWAANSGLSKNLKVSIKKVDDTHVSISQLFDYVTISSATFDPSAMTLTVPAGWSHPYGMPGDNPELVFNVSDDFNTLTLPGKYTIGGYMSVTDFTLTR